MPTKILVVETPTFQIGANAGDKAERVAPEGFADRLAKHVAEAGNDTLFVLAPSDVRHQTAFADAANGASDVSLCYFNSVNDAIRFLPSILLFAGDVRPQGVKCYLQKQSTIYTEALFNADSVGSKFDPAFAFARSRLTGPDVATNAWACAQALAFLGLQSLPSGGEKGTGEKVDVQLGADEKVVAFSVRFQVPKDRASLLRGSPILSVPRFAAHVIETRYVESAEQMEFTCLFFRAPGFERPIELTTWSKDADLEKAADVQTFTFKPFSAIAGDAGQASKPKGGFKKKFSEQAGLAPPAPAPAAVVSSDSSAPYAPTLVVSGNASLANDKSSSSITELEAKVRVLEASLKFKDELLAKHAATGEVKRDVLTNIKDGQSEGLKQNIKVLEQELAECKEREKELMKMVDKAVQMKEDAAKRIKELDVKLKAASTGGGSKVQMLEKALEEQKRQNKELSKRVSEMNEKLRAA